MMFYIGFLGYKCDGVMGHHTYVSALLHPIKTTPRRHIAPSTPRGLGLTAGSRRVGRHAPQQSGWVGRDRDQQGAPIGTVSLLEWVRQGDVTTESRAGGMAGHFSWEPMPCRCDEARGLRPRGWWGGTGRGD